MLAARRLAVSVLGVAVAVAWAGCSPKSGAPDNSPGVDFDSGMLEIDASPDDSSMPQADATMSPEAAADSTSPQDGSPVPEATMDVVPLPDVRVPDASPDVADSEAQEAAAEAGPDAVADAPAGCTVDGVQDGQETDVDCGGVACDAQMRVCANGKLCGIGADCQSKVCTGGVCQVPTCTDGVQNGNETAVDCGGAPCDSQGYTCADGLKCLTAFDCTDLLCGPSNTCAFPSCTDGVKNGGETGIDCGNTAVTGCMVCPAGQGCNVGADCQSLDCKLNVCQIASCNDGILNEGESDVDCGQVCVLKLCASGRKCFTNADCQSSVCLGGGTCM